MVTGKISIEELHTMTCRDLMSNGVYSETPMHTAQIFPPIFSPSTEHFS